MQRSGLSISCGVISIYDLSRSVKRFLDLYKEGRGVPFVIFSDTVRRGRGRALAKGLRKYGKVTKFGPAENPNSSGKIELFVWVPAPVFRKRVTKEYNDTYLWKW